MIWVDRDTSLVPTAMVACGDAAVALARKLVIDPRPGLRGVAGSRLLALLGATDRLPWVDGAIWLGVDPLAPALLLPTTRAPSDPIEWVEAAVLRHVRGPAAILEDGSIIAVAQARPVGADEIARFLAGSWP